MTIKSKPNNQKYLDNYDRIFGKKEPEQLEFDYGPPGVDLCANAMDEYIEKYEKGFDFGDVEISRATQMATGPGIDDPVNVISTYAMEQWERLKQECIADGLLLDPGPDGPPSSAVEAANAWFANRARINTSGKNFDRYGNPVTPGAVMDACRHGPSTETRGPRLRPEDEALEYVKKYAGQKYKYKDYKAKKVKTPEWDPNYPHKPEEEQS